MSSLIPPNLPFLALPPPNPSRSSSIAAWINTVHPGSPAPPTPVLHPRSPVHSSFRRPSLSLRPSRSRRTSISATRSRVNSTSFLNLSDTPITTSALVLPSPLIGDGESKFDLTSFGYASVFAINLPTTTPKTPEMYKPKSPPTNVPLTPTPKTTVGMFKRIQSIATRTKSSSSKAKQTKRTKPRPVSDVSNYVAISSKKRAKYTASPSGATAIEKKKRAKYAADLPLTVLQEAQMRQVFEGGSLDSNIQKIMQEKGKKEGALKVEVVKGTKVVEGVEDVWRDGNGGLWWDQEEQLEFAHLLGGNVPVSACATAEEWIAFGDKERDQNSIISSPRSSRDSDLHESYALKIDDSMDDLRVISRTRSNSVGSFPSSSLKVSVLLSTPPRPNRIAKHLRKPGFLLEAFPVPKSPRTTHPSSSVQEASRSVKRRRAAPPPLQLVPLSPCLKTVINQDGEEEGKKEFLADSFEPCCANKSSARVKNDLLKSSAPTVGMKKKSALGLSTLFKKGERK